MAQQINLFNPVFLKQKKYFSSVTMLQSLGLLLGGVVAFYGYTHYETQSLRRVSADTARQLAAQTEQLARITKDFSPAGRSKLLEEETARMAARLRQREELMSALRTGGLGNSDGFARYLAAFARQSTSGVWLTGLTIGGDEVELQMAGRVLHPDLMPVYLRALNREEVMRGRRISEMRLTARESAPAVTNAPGAAPAAAGTPPAAPLRFVEFNVTATRGSSTGTGQPAPQPAGQPAAPGSTAAAPGLPSLAGMAGLKDAKGAK